MSRHLMILSLVLFASDLASSPARADVLYSTFGPAPGFNIQSGAVVSIDGGLFNMLEDVAMSFTISGGDRVFTGFHAAFLGADRPDVYLTFHLIADTGNKTPGVILDTIRVLVPQAPSPGFSLENILILAGTSSSQVILHAGTRYWLATDVTADDAYSGAWASSNLSIPVSIPAAYSIDNAVTWYGYGSWPLAFSIEGQAVPEPSSLAMAGMGAGLGLATAWLRRRKSPQQGR